MPAPTPPPRRAAYYLQRSAGLPVYAKILALMAAGLPIIAAAALAYQRVSGLAYGESLYKVRGVPVPVPAGAASSGDPKRWLGKEAIGA